MPALSEEAQIFDFLIEDLEPLTINFTKQEKTKALEEAKKYLADKTVDVRTLQPLSIYYILTKLSSSKQIEFIKNNLAYLKEKDEDIFFYRKAYPKEVVFYFSYEVIKSIYELDLELFENVIKGNIENVFESFTHADYLDYFKEFKPYILKINPNRLFHIFYEHSRHCLKPPFTKELFETRKKQNKELLSFFIENYQEKIESFSPQDLLNFISYLEDKKEYQAQINQNKDKLKIALESLEEYELDDYLCENTNVWQQDILFSNFLDSIVKNRNIKKIVPRLSSSVILKLYQQNKDIFQSMELLDWLKICSQGFFYDENLNIILDNYEIEDISHLFDESFLPKYGTKKNISALKYIENKYRRTLSSNNLTPISEISSITSRAYFENLAYLKAQLIAKKISKKDAIYEENLTKFVLYLKENSIISNLNNSNIRVIDKYFYRLVMGFELANLYRISSIEEMSLLNRLGKEEFNANDFTVEQLEGFNVKQYHKLCKSFESAKAMQNLNRNLILRLFLLVGYNHAKEILELDSDLNTLEHLVGNVSVKDIKLDNQGNPILNKKLMNLLFSSPNNSRITTMLKNKDTDLYKYFPRILNEWEMIEINNKTKSLNNIIEFLKTDDISLPPKYYRLEGLFKQIGCKNEIVNETLSLHDKMLERQESSIPRVVGDYNGHCYEVLKLDDMESLVVGNKTDCCFTILGNGYSCLKHATTSKNGRVLVIKKDNLLLAHSWLWRNGNLLCLDNIETSKSLNKVDFLAVYLKFADEIIAKSFESEGEKTCIKNITIGYTSFDKSIVEASNFPYLISKNCNLDECNLSSRIGPNRIFLDKLPQPFEDVSYTDSKNVQILIRGKGNFNLKNPNCAYLDERDSIMTYKDSEDYDNTYLEKLSKIIDSLRYLKYSQERNSSAFTSINLTQVVEASCNKDWYSLTYQDGTKEEYLNSKDSRAREEMCQEKSYSYIKKINNN